MPEIGKLAPQFTLPANGGQVVSLSDYVGKTVVLFFYTKDDTSGCTRESIDFTANLDHFAEANAVVLGVSKDSVAKHDKFIAKHDLGMVLLSDEHSSTCEDYGVWKEKSMYGRKFWGIERSTFLIGPDGTLRAEWRKVKVPGHVDEVLAAAKSL
jgi:peroxiredoxin Q/BCP